MARFLLYINYFVVHPTLDLQNRIGVNHFIIHTNDKSYKYDIIPFLFINSYILTYF